MDAAELKTRLGNGEPGTYILCLQLKRSQDITIGKLGNFNFRKGYYYYVGSAFGPGGVAARCKHHIAISVKPRWHIDYLRAQCKLISIYFNASNKHLEHDWANHLGKILPYPIEKFGSSDCSCNSHLFFAKHTVFPDKFFGQIRTINFQ